jgi:hypothetical protein
MRMGYGHASYCYLWPVQLCIIFPHYLINGKIFEETLLNIKCAFDMNNEIHFGLHVKCSLFLSDFNET